MKRILMLLSVAAMMVMAAVAASPAFAVCPHCPVEANDQAQGSWRTGAFAAEDTPAAKLGIVTSFRQNTQP